MLQSTASCTNTTTPLYDYEIVLITLKLSIVLFRLVVRELGIIILVVHLLLRV